MTKTNKRSIETGVMNILGHRIKFLIRQIDFGVDSIKHGYGNGYVEFRGQELFKEAYKCPVTGRDKYPEIDDLDFKVHGGITFASKFNDLPEDNDIFWLGFDTCHFEDGEHLDRQFVLGEIEKLANQVLSWEIDQGVRKLEKGDK